MQTYVLPKELIEKFMEVARENITCPTEGHKETLAYLLGLQEGTTISASHLIFPNQEGTSSKVDDLGKSNFYTFQERNRYLVWTFIIRH